VKRPDAAQTALSTYVELVGDQGASIEEQIVDLLADLMHLAHQSPDVDEDWDALARKAVLHFEYEEAGDDA
jgi:hypothetical protein